MRSDLSQEVAFLQGRVFRLEKQMRAVIRAYWKLEEARRQADSEEGVATGEALDILLAAFGEPQEPTCLDKYL